MHERTASDMLCDWCRNKLKGTGSILEEDDVATERKKHRDHSRKIGLRCAELLVREWPTLHLDGFDVDRAAVLIAVELPTCMIEFELAVEQDIKANPPEPIDPSRSIGARLRKALGVDDVSTLEAIEIAIVRLTKKGG